MGSLNHPVTETEFISFYTIAGGLLRIEAGDDWVRRWVAGFLDGYHLIKLAGPSTGRAAITLRVRRDASFSVPPDLRTFAINRGVCHTDGASYYLEVDESLI